jgi:hypothetical protein
MSLPTMRMAMRTEGRSLAAAMLSCWIGLAMPALAASQGASAVAAGASASDPARVAAFGRLPNWRGFWEQFDIGPSGKPEATEVARATAGPSPRFTDAWLERMKSETKHNPLADRVCTFGFPTLLESSPLLFEIVSVPEETVMIFNMREVRHIYTDGKGHAPEDVRLATPWGDSIGRWEGDTLDIETISSNGLFRYRNEKGENDSTYLSEQAVYLERLRKLDAKTLEDSFTVVDPVALREPYRFTRRYHLITGMDRVVEELDCEATGTNDRNPIVNGQWTLTHPGQ